MRTIPERIAELSTPVLSDALDRLGIEGQAIGILPLKRSMTVIGQAFTVRMLPVGLSGKRVGEYIDDVPTGRVVVIDNGGRLDATVWGDIMTAAARRNGIAGTVIDGVCRDARRSVELGYPIFSRSHTMRTGKGRVCAEAYAEPVQLAGVRVEPEDWIAGDTDGVVVLPASRVEEILAAAEEIDRIEDRIRDAVGRGERLDRVRDAVGYHGLQSRRDRAEK